VSDLIKFKDHVSIRPLYAPADKKTQYIDSVLKSIDEQKANNVAPEDINGLQVRITASHAGRLTGHYHLYLPGKVKAGTDTFVKPYKKPILTHHDTMADPIGRVQSSVYQSTPNPFIPASVANELENPNAVLNKAYFKNIDKIKSFLYDKLFPGLGYISLVGNVTDENAIPKVLDGRYNTVSVGYSTDQLFCSICHQDWLADGPCDHTPGKVYKKDRMFWIFGNMNYDEVSYVNEPADELAANQEIRRILIPVQKDFMRSKGEDRKNKLANFIAHSNQLIDDVLLVPNTNSDFYYFDSKSHDLIKISETNEGDTMTIKDLRDLSPVDLHAKLKELIDEKDRISDEDYEKLSDEAFVGDRFLPAHNKAYIDASKKLLEGVEDSEDKTELITYLDTRLEIFKDKPSDDTNQQSTDGDNSKTSVVFEYKDNKVIGPVADAIDETTKNAFIDYLGISIPTLEKMIDEIIEKNDTAQADAIFEKLKAKFTFDDVAKKELDQIQLRFDTLSKEYKLAVDTLKNQENIIESLNNELKDNYIDMILALKKRQNPETTLDQERDFLKNKSVKELKASLEILHTFFTTDTNSDVPEIEDPSYKHDAASPDIDIKKLEREIQSTYQALRSSHGDAIAQNYLDAQTKKLKKLKKTTKQ
jgi:hypothetical protein